MPYPVTTNLKMAKPPDGDKAWGQAMRDNLDTLDGIASIERQVAATTPSLGFYETAHLEVDLSQAADLTVLVTDHPAWVRIYGSAAARLEDAARTITTKVTDGRGCYGDAITYEPDGLTLNWSEVPTFQNLDIPRTGTAYLAVTSMDPAYSGPINLTLSYRERGPRTGAQQGLQGLDGHTILCLTRDPVATDGKDGDICINTAAWTVFAPKAAGAWPAGVSLVGPAGATGATGADGSPGANGAPGADGNTILYGPRDPVGTDGVDGNFWINNAVPTSLTIFGPKAAGAWPAGVALGGSGGGSSSVLEIPVGVPGSLPASGDVQIFADHLTGNLIPTMTGYTAPSGTVSASSEYSGYPAWQAVDADPAGTGWCSVAGLPQWIQYQFPSAVVVTAYSMAALSGYTNRMPSDFTLQGSNDGSTWTTLDSRTGVSGWSGTTAQTFSAANTTAYTHYRLNITANGGAGYATLGSFQLIGQTAAVGLFLRDSSGTTKQLAFA